MRERLRLGDDKMVAAYSRKRGLQAFDARFVYRRGDLVMERTRVPGRNAPHATGPHTFVSYTSESGLVCVIRDTGGKER